MINSKEQIVEYFKSGIKEKKDFKIGIEHEKFLFNNKDNKRINYSKVKEMFTALLEFGVKRKDLFNPKINISLGIKFLDSLIKKYRGNIGIALSHYNGGSAVGKWPKVKIIPATYPYVEKVLKNSYKLGNHTPSLLKIRNIRTNKTNDKLDKKYIFSEIDLLLNNIDKWLNIYNGHQKSIVKDNKYVLSNKQVIFQGKGTNAQAFY